ncbi:MAG: hypothetical protein M3281_01695, partial [Chloroflexota bacterium]|nr:hypothetical protein [Chloroflexota bacterium]
AVVWDFATGKELALSDGEGLPMTYTPDGTRLAVIGPYTSIDLLDIASGRVTRNLATNQKNVPYMLRSSPDGQWLAVAGLSGVVTVMNVDTGQVALRLAGHTGAIVGINFSPDSERLATASFDGTVRVWNLGSVLETPASADANQVRHLKYCAGGKYLVIADVEKGTMVLDPQSGKEVMSLPDAYGGTWDVSCSADGRRVAANGNDYAVVWDFATGKELRRVDHPDEPQSQVALSPDGTRLVVGYYRPEEQVGGARVFDVTSGKLLLSFPAGQAGVDSVVYSSDGSRNATGSDQGGTWIWDARTGRRVLALLGHTDRVYELAFSSDGTKLATGSRDATARLWDTRTGRLLLTAFSASTVEGVAFSPDGKVLATASLDDTTRLWDVGTGTETLRITSDGGGMAFPTFSPDGSRMAMSVNEFGQLRQRLHIYLLRFDDLIKLAESRVTRSLTKEERAQYLHE